MTLTCGRLATFASVVLTAALTLVTGCTPREQVRQMSGNTWGTVYHITYTSPTDLSASAIEQMSIIDSTLSMFNPASEVSKINRTEYPVKVSATFRDIFDLSVQVNRLSGGVFDPTVAPLVDLWGFGRKDPADTIPDTLQIRRMLGRVGIAGCSVSEQNVLIKKHPLTEFDFSAIAKGYGVDCIAAALARAGTKDYMVEVGGEIALAGKNPRGEPWHIQIDAPVCTDTVTHQQLTVLTVTDCCIATSGNYRRWLDTPAGRISHTISPLSGLPVAGNTVSATVIAPACALADALATACMAMPVNEALKMIETMPGDVSAMLVIASGDTPSDSLSVITSKKWPGDRPTSRF